MRFRILLAMHERDKRSALFKVIETVRNEIVIFSLANFHKLIDIWSVWFSPSGCTFWGKKPWSRKKKLLWQLGTLVGAPVGIALVAGIAVPAMIIGKLRIEQISFYRCLSLWHVQDTWSHVHLLLFDLIGIPVWIGRKLHTRYRLSGKHKRNFAMLGGVAASVSVFFLISMNLLFEICQYDLLVEKLST